MEQKNELKLIKDFIESDVKTKYEFSQFLKSKSKNRYVLEPKEGEDYWFIDSFGEVSKDVWLNYPRDQWRFDNIPLWKSYAACLRYIEVRDFINKYSRPFIEGKENYLIVYNYKLKDVGIIIDTVYSYDSKAFNHVDDAEDVIKEIGVKDLKEYYLLIDEKTTEEELSLAKEFIEANGLTSAYNELVDFTAVGRYTKEPEFGDTYWYAENYGCPELATWTEDIIDFTRYKLIPLWETKRDVDSYISVQLYIKSKAKPFVQGEENYCLKYNNAKRRVEYTIFIKTQFPNVDYFESEEICQEIINAIGDSDLKKYYFLKNNQRLEGEK